MKTEMKPNKGVQGTRHKVSGPPTRDGIPLRRIDRELWPHIFTTIAALIIIVLQAIIGGWLESTGRLRAEDINMAAYKAFNFYIFLVLAFSMVRPILRAFVTMQTMIGNGNRAPIRFVRMHERAITWGLWGFWSAGLAIALPTMIEMGFFK